MSTKRLGAALFEVARAAAGFIRRSLSRKIGHRAQIGWALEQSPCVMAPAVLAVLEGRGSYDQLNLQEQAIVGARWAKSIEETRKNLRLGHILAAQGRDVVELDDQGAMVVRKSRAVRPVHPKS